MGEIGRNLQIQTRQSPKRVKIYEVLNKNGANGGLYYRHGLVIITWQYFSS